MKDLTDTLAAAVQLEPNWDAVSADVSARVRQVLRVCLQKDPRQRAHTAAGGQWQVSTAGGAYPRWRPDGRELYYLAPTGAMMASPIAVTGASAASGAPVALFPTRIVGGADSGQGRQYDVTRDGRFLINTVLDAAAAPITLILSWNPEAKR